jgi:ribonuclease-3
MVADFIKLQLILEYDFSDQALLQMALTHASSASGVTYERLEFLGDRVLGLAVAEILYSKFSMESEGDLARRLASLVQGTTLATIAREIDLGVFIHFSESERNAGGAENDHILADVLEALLGALYLDGGFKSCKALIERLWGDRFYKMLAPPMHPKTQVQEWAQGQGLPLPVYEICEQSGPDHAPIFKISLTVDGYGVVIAEGKSRQEAEKQAAKAFVAQQGL